MSARLIIARRLAVLLVLDDLDPVVVGVCDPVSKEGFVVIMSVGCHLPRTKATFFILPSVSFFFHCTPFSSNLLQAASRLSTDTQMWPKP